MLVFDKQRRRCVSPPTEDCDVPVTTPAPEDEEIGNGGGGLDNRGSRPRGDLGENRRRFQTNQDQLPPPGALPFNLPEGAQILQRPINN